MITDYGYNTRLEAVEIAQSIAKNGKWKFWGIAKCMGAKYVAWRTNSRWQLECMRRGTLDEDYSEIEILSEGERYFRLHPVESRVLGRMLDEGFFVVNPEESESEPIACNMFQTSEDIQTYCEKNPDAKKLWTVEEHEGKMYVEEGSHIVNRIATLIQNPSYRGDLLWRRREAKRQK